jgi:hypothetical protein
MRICSDLPRKRFRPKVFLSRIQRVLSAPLGSYGHGETLHRNSKYDCSGGKNGNPSRVLAVVAHQHAASFAVALFQLSDPKTEKYFCIARTDSAFHA